MDYYIRIQRSIDFIEENLTVDITLEEVAEKAYCSLSRFHQIFQAIVGYSVKEYIRKRRLTAAAMELISTEERILDIAFKYQYETPESFTRAFNKVYGMTPIKYRRAKEHALLLNKINLYNRIAISKNGGIIMEPKIVIKEEFTAMGIEIRTSFEDEEFSMKIKDLWSDFNSQNLLSEIPNKVDSNTCLGMSCDFDGDGNFSYFLCSEVDKVDEVPEGMNVKVIPSTKYAVFTVKGGEKQEIGRKLGEAWTYFFNSWLPNSGYEQPGVYEPNSGKDYNEETAANFELYDERFTESNFEVDLYIPIK